jgi:hypothetical protein
MIVSFALALALAGFGITACTGPSCTRNSDCQSPSVCNAVGLCAPKPVVVDGDGGAGDGGDADGGATATTPSSADSGSGDGGSDGGSAPSDGGDGGLQP